MNRACLSGDPIILARDFNAKLGKDIIPGDSRSISSNGRRGCKRFFCSGVFTRINNNNPNEKSVLDYVCVTEDLSHLVTSMLTDEQKLCTLWRKLKRRRRYTDHNALLLTVKISVSKCKCSKKSKRDTVWNFNDPKRWKKFHELTERDKQYIVGRTMMILSHAIINGKGDYHS